MISLFTYLAIAFFLFGCWLWYDDYHLMSQLWIHYDWFFGWIYSDAMLFHIVSACFALGALLL